MTEPVLMPGKWITLRQCIRSSHARQKSMPFTPRTSWRGFAFFPRDNTVYEAECLKTITGWIQTLNQSHREQLKARKEAQA
ncbi:MAG: hypothetical protein GX171_02560 [Clostridiales bacterium]|jgi:hypothetical protein|nr:hypothetical protein [Clostridiales bacterium]